MRNDRVVVTGGGGFIGGHLVARLREQGHAEIRAVDVKPLDQWYQVHPDVENVTTELRNESACDRAAQGRRRSTTWPRTWAAWASSRTRPSA